MHSDNIDKDGFIKVIDNNGDLLKESKTHANKEEIEFWEKKLNISKITTLQEIKEMLITMELPGSLRERENGLIEFRSTKYGSVYARTKDELHDKLIKKIKEEKSHVKSRKCKEASHGPLLSEFYYNTYLPFKKENLAPDSITSIQFDFDCIVKGNFDKPLDMYTPEEIEKFLLAIPMTRKRQKVRGTLNNIFRHAKKLGKLTINPMDNVEKVKHVKKQGEALSFIEQDKFFDRLFKAKLSDIKKLYLIFVYLTGARRSEALSLNYTDIDFEGNVLHIPGTKTTSSNRYMPLFPLVKKLLLCVNPNSDGVIFPLTRNKAGHTMDAITKDNHLHELRHTFGTIAVCVQKLDPKTVSLYMGHTGVGMTLSTYTHPEQLDRSLFYDGSYTEEEKVEIMKQKYNAILNKISDFLDGYTQTVPKK